VALDLPQLFDLPGQLLQHVRGIEQPKGLMARLGQVCRDRVHGLSALRLLDRAIGRQ
jgi:hypothetical protein